MKAKHVIDLAIADAATAARLSKPFKGIRFTPTFWKERFVGMAIASAVIALLMMAVFMFIRTPAATEDDMRKKITAELTDKADLASTKASENAAKAMLEAERNARQADAVKASALALENARLTERLLGKP